MANTTSDPALLHSFLHDALPICLDGTQLIVDAGQERRIRPDLGGHVPKLEDGPWPAFPADLMSIAIVVAIDMRDRKSTRLNSSHVAISYAVFCLKKKKNPQYLSY